MNGSRANPNKQSEREGSFRYTSCVIASFCLDILVDQPEIPPTGMPTKKEVEEFVLAATLTHPLAERLSFSFALPATAEDWDEQDRAGLHEVHGKGRE